MKYKLVVSAFALALTLSACEKTPVVSFPGMMTTPPVSTSPAPSAAAPLPSVKMVTSDDLPTGSQSKSNPQGSMSKQEESMAMPKPGQANDHSTPVLHPPAK